MQIDYSKIWYCRLCDVFNICAEMRENVFYNIKLYNTRLSVSFALECHALASFFQQLKNNLTIAYEKLDIFRSPLYMALSYEEKQGPLHSLLAQTLWDISSYVNASTVMLRNEVSNFNFQLNRQRKNIHESFPDTSLFRITDRSWRPGKRFT